MAYTDNDFFKNPFFGKPFFKGRPEGKHFEKPKRKKRITKTTKKKET